MRFAAIRVAIVMIAFGVTGRSNGQPLPVGTKIPLSGGSTAIKRKALRIASDPAGRTLVCFKISATQGGCGWMLPTGESQAGFALPPLAELDRAAASSNAAGEFVVAFSQGLSSIEAQRYDSAGAQIGSGFRVSTYGTLRHSPDVAVNTEGGFMVVWERSTTLPSS